jgi:hypothetical protein
MQTTTNYFESDSQYQEQRNSVKVCWVASKIMQAVGISKATVSIERISLLAVLKERLIYVFPCLRVKKITVSDWRCDKNTAVYCKCL